MFTYFFLFLFGNIFHSFDISKAIFPVLYEAFWALFHVCSGHCPTILMVYRHLSFQLQHSVTNSQTMVQSRTWQFAQWTSKRQSPDVMTSVLITLLLETFLRLLGGLAAVIGHKKWHLNTKMCYSSKKYFYTPCSKLISPFRTDTTIS